MNIINQTPNSNASQHPILCDITNITIIFLKFYTKHHTEADEQLTCTEVQLVQA